MSGEKKPKVRRKDEDIPADELEGIVLRKVGKELRRLSSGRARKRVMAALVDRAEEEAMAAAASDAFGG